MTTFAPPPPERAAPPPPGPHAAPRRIVHDPDSVAAYIAVLRRRRGLLIALPLLFAAAGLAFGLTRSRMYLARAAFVATEPSSMSGSLGALSSVASQLGIPGLSAFASGSASVSAQFYGDLLTSNELLHAAVSTRYDAAGGPLDGAAFRGTLIEYFKPTGRTATDREIAAMKRLGRKALVVTVDRPTGIVRMEVRTKNRMLSALVARRLLDLVNEFNLRRRQTQAGAERDFSARRSRAALDTLLAAEAALADFRATNIDFSRSPRLATRETELQRRVTLAQQIYTTVAQRYELANIEAVRNTPVVTVLDAPENLVEARPRGTLLMMAGGLFGGLVIACVIALGAERSGARR